MKKIILIYCGFLILSFSAHADSLYDGMTIQCYPNNPEVHSDFYVVRRFFINEDQSEVGDLMIDLVKNPNAMRDPEEFGLGLIKRDISSNIVTGSWEKGDISLTITPKTGAELLKKHRYLKWPHWNGIITFGAKGNSNNKDYIFNSTCSVFCLKKSNNPMDWINPINHCALTEESRRVH